jgi:hypothetical protein
MIGTSRVQGHERCEDTEADAAFRSWARDLKSFAERHHLAVWRYPGRAAAWMFHFLHPAGGFCWLQLYCVRQKEAAPLETWISAHWYIDDHEKKLRWEQPYRESIKTRSDAKAIVSALETQLDILVRTPRDQLVPREYSFAPTGDGRGDFFVSDFERSLRVAV